MKKYYVTLVALAIMAASIGGIMMCSCHKDPVKSAISELKSLKIEDIDKISSEMADFHTFTMRKFLTEIYSEKDILDDNSVEKIVNFIKQEMRDYDFKYIQLNEDNLNFSEFLNLKNIKTMISLSENGYDLSGLLNLDLPSAQSSELKTYLASLNTVAIQTKLNNIELNVPEIIGKSEDFEEFKSSYLKFVENELVDVQTHDEYMYIRIFADTYLSSFEYVTEFLFQGNSKGKFWDTVKEAWNQAKPIVAADASGAVMGAMLGVIGTGPGIVVGGMGGACAGSAGYCVGKLMGAK
jgi:hypothetical protein